MTDYNILGALGRAKDADNLIELQDDDDVVYKLKANSTSDAFELVRNGTVIASWSNGGAVTQITTAATGVTLNSLRGQITTVALTTAAAAEEGFTVTNSKVAATDVVSLSTTYDGGGTPMLGVKAVAAGSFKVVITNLHASAALDAAMTINFVVHKSQAS